MNHRVIKAGAEHIAQICQIDQQSNPSPWSTGIVQRYLDKQAIDICIAGDQICAFTVCQQVTIDAELLLIAVAEDFRRRGLASYMIDGLTQKLIQNGAQRIFLEVRESNTAAIQLYETTGFNQVGIRPNYYPTGNGREDALLYCCELCD